MTASKIRENPDAYKDFFISLLHLALAPAIRAHEILRAVRIPASAPSDMRREIP
jgi:hypothetical protein